MSDPITLLADPEGGSTLVLDLPRLVARLRDDPTLFRTLESLRRTVSPRDLPAPDEVIRDDRNRILVRGLDNDWREFTGGVAADGDPTAPVVPGDEIDAVIVRTQGLFAQQAQMNALTLDTALVGDVIGNVSGFASSLQTPITLNGLELNAGTVSSLVASDIQSGTFDPARIPDLDAAKVASGTLDAARIPDLDADKVASGTLDSARIPNLDADKIATGTLDAARIPGLDADKVASGTLSVDRIPNLDADKVASGTLDAARIPDLDAAKVATGTLDAARIPGLDADKVASGTLDAARIPDLDADKVATGTLDAARIPLMSADKINEGILPVERGGTGVATSTGSGNLVLSSGPTFGGTVAAPTVQTGALVFETPTLATPTPPELDEARATFWIDTNANTAYLLYRPPGAASPIRFPIAAEPDP